MYQLFTSESVANGHPDKVCDQISDAILDNALEQDPNSRVACEVIIKTGLVLIAGEMTTKAWVDVDKIARRVIRNIGYQGQTFGFDADTCAVINSIGRQSQDIARGVDRDAPENMGAGDQGLMFGYACNETPSMMPAAIMLSHQLMERHNECRQQGIANSFGPDAKAQVTLRYQNDQIIGIDTVVLSTQHLASVTQEEVHKAVMSISLHLHFQKSGYLMIPNILSTQPVFSLLRPVADSGLTGRKSL